MVYNSFRAKESFGGREGLRIRCARFKSLGFDKLEAKGLRLQPGPSKMP